MARWLPLLAAFLVVTATAAVTNAQGGLRIVASTMGSIEVPPMGYYAIRVDPETGQITPMELHQEPLPAAAQEALQRVPKWIRPLLERQFRLLMQDYMVLEGNSRPAVGDINGDGLPDLIVGASDGTLHVYINVGNAIEPLFKEMEVISLGGLIGEDPGSVVTPALGDADGDSLVDIVVGVESGSVYLLKNTGTQGSPSWGLEADYFAGVSVSGNATPFLWDADGDGDLDLVLGSSDGVIHCYLNQGSPAAPVWVEDPEYFPAWLEDWWDGRGPHYEGVWVGNDSRPILFTWGSNLYLIVGAVDASGNVGPASTVTVVVDTTPPSIELRDVADGQVFTEDNITVHGWILGAAEAYLDGEPLELAEDGSYEVAVHLVDGLNTLTFTGRDEAGNEATLTVRV